MKLAHIDLSKLKPSALNVRKHGAGNVDDLIASIRALGVIQPLLVRPNCEGFEVVAGQRRLLACQALAVEPDCGLADIPCAIMEAGDDALAIEASLAENAARMPMDELDQYAAFAALIRQSKNAEEIAADFGVTERLVKQRLAIANLYPPILAAYRRKDIDVQTMRTLTLATKRQQQHWFKMFKDEDSHAPTGRALKSWLFGGADIPVSSALFPREEYPGAIKADLFGEEEYFTDAGKFWECQNRAIAAKREALLQAGWTDVVILEPGERFHEWEHVVTSRKKGGRVYIELRQNGEATIHEGFLTEKEYRRRNAEKAGATEDAIAPQERPELSKAAQNYLDLHRHAAVRVELLKHPGSALRLISAHMIFGSSLWRIASDPQRADKREIAESLAASKSEAAFAAEREAVLDLLGLAGDGACVVRNGDDYRLAELFLSLLRRSDEEVLRILAFLMAETLQAGSCAVETLGVHLKVDMRSVWQPDETFFDLLRDKQGINAMLAHIGGDTAAQGNIAATAKTQKQIIRNFLSGKDRTKAEGWLPRYMEFPFVAYTQRGGGNLSDNAARVAELAP